jgi:hypothetical protein
VAVGIHGTQDGSSDDPFWLTPPSPLDAPAIQGPLSKDRREDLQTLSFALAASLVDNRGHPIGIARGGDPPDRIISANDVSIAVELTELTVSEIRSELARARQLGRLLQTELTRCSQRFQHLVGRRVALAVLPANESEPPEHAQVIQQICAMLEEDRGCVGDGVDLSAGLPDPWPNDRGF